MKETMTSEERVEAFKRELGLILRQILELDQAEKSVLPQVADEARPAPDHSADQS